jgi:uncharacterized protein (DUF2147 family)
MALFYKSLKAAGLVALLSPPSWAGIMGTWRTADGDARVEVYRCGDVACGRIAWMRAPLKDGKPRVDEKNPKPELRGLPVQGLVILHGFREEKPRVWTGGRLYDPKSGNDYRGRLTLLDENHLRLRGYVGVSLFGRSETWTREEKSSP